MTVAAQKQIAALINKYGQPVALLRGGVTTTVPGLIAPLDSTTDHLFFDSNTSVGLVRPAVILYTDGGASGGALPQVNDTFFNSDFTSVGSPRLLTIEQVAVYRLSNVPVLILSLCD